MSKARFVDGRDIVDSMRLVKSKQEIRLLRESARWCEFAHDILLENVRSGVHDGLIAVRSSDEALARMLKRLGQCYVQFKNALSAGAVGFTGPVGRGSAMPHAVYS